MNVENYSDKYFLDVVRLVEQFHAEAVNEYEALFDAGSLISTIKENKLDNSKNCFLLILDGKCRGIIYGARAKSPISGQMIFQEIIWFVEKPFRRWGVTLLNGVENMLKSQGISIMIMAVLENSKTEKLKRFYARLGYKPIETHFMRAL